MARPLARRLARPLGRSTARPADMSHCQFALGQDAKEDSIHNAIEYDRGMARRNSARRSTAQPSARHYIKADTFSIAFACRPIRWL
eukprot:5103921-Pyramimonas_sp.AAC.1